MASTYGNDLRLEEIGDGEQSGTWGATTNTNLELIAEALSFGTEAITTNADTHTTTIADGATDPGRSLYLKYTGTLDSACTITIAPNSISKTWYIENGTSGSQSIIISQGSGANVTIKTGQTKIVYSDGAGSGAAMAEIGTLAVANLAVDINATISGTLDTSGAVNLNLGTDSTSSTSGALIVDGGVGIAKKLFVGTDLDVDGTTNLDAVDIDGAVQLDATLTVGANDQGYDVILHGDTASANVTWDTSADDLILNGAAGLIVPDGKLTLASTAVTSTAAELNQLDAITRGSILYGNASGATARLAKGSAGTVLTSDGTDLSWAEGGAAFGGAAFSYSSNTTLGSSQLNAFIGITSANTVLTLPTPSVGSYYVIKYIPTSGVAYVKPSGTNTVDGFSAAVKLNSTTDTNFIMLGISNTAWESIGYTNVSAITASTAVASATYNKPSYVSAILACVGGCTADGEDVGGRGGNYSGYYTHGGVGGQGYSEKLLTGSSYGYTIGAAGSTTATTFDSISVSASTTSTGGGNGGVGSGGSFNATGGAGGALNVGTAATSMGLGPSGGAATRAGNGGAGYDGGDTYFATGGGGGTGGNAGSKTVPGAAATSEASGVGSIGGQTGITFNPGGANGATGAAACGGAKAETTITLFTGQTLKIGDGMQGVSARSNYFGQATGFPIKLTGYVTILEFV